MKISFTSRVLHYVTQHKKVTINQVLAAVGMHIDATRAMRHYERIRKSERRRRLLTSIAERGPVEDPLEQGRRCVVKDTLRALYQRKLLKRVRPGEYQIAA